MSFFKLMSLNLTRWSSNFCFTLTIISHKTSHINHKTSFGIRIGHVWFSHYIASCGIAENTQWLLNYELPSDSFQITTNESNSRICRSCTCTEYISGLANARLRYTGIRVQINELLTLHSSQTHIYSPHLEIHTYPFEIALICRGFCDDCKGRVTVVICSLKRHRLSILLWHYDSWRRCERYDRLVGFAPKLRSPRQTSRLAFTASEADGRFPCAINVHICTCDRLISSEGGVSENLKDFFPICTIMTVLYMTATLTVRCLFNLAC